jgi:hypothetical protein
VLVQQTQAGDVFLTDLRQIMTAADTEIRSAAA